MLAGIWSRSKGGANYRPASTSDTRCDHCKYMFPPLVVGGCRIVRGLIQGSHTCDQFTPRWRANTWPTLEPLTPSVLRTPGAEPAAVRPAGWTAWRRGSPA